MDKLLFLPHRLPYPPNKGDKVRSYHLLRYLAERYRVFVGTFMDDPRDEQYIGKLREFCAGLEVVRLNPKLAKLRSLRGLLTGEALTLPYYRDAALARWVEQTVREQGIRTVVVFSSAMAQYVPRGMGLRVLTDFVDVDSAKWSQYAENKRWPMSWIYRREGKRLLAFERQVAERSEASFFVTEAEVALFRSLVPDCSARIEAVGNGVDHAFFSPDASSASPYRPDEIPVVFTGAMDYWPNVDAVNWFVVDILPALRKKLPTVRFYIVGMKPTAAVRELAGEHVVVTGTVPDVRPYLEHAGVVVAPLRVARGVQNKVLEAMSMGRPVVVARACAGGIDAEDGTHFSVAEDAAGFVERIVGLLQDPERLAAMGRAAREQILARYSWQAQLEYLGRYLEPAQPVDTRENVALGAG
jgi:sugar transferase (PEP-CTERM/EpsH1 system associated)